MSAPVGRSHRKCENPGCNVVKEYYPSDIARGKGVYCSRQCAQYNRHTLTYLCICANCSNKFKSTNPNAEFCCIECEEAKLTETT